MPHSEYPIDFSYKDHDTTAGPVLDGQATSQNAANTTDPNFSGISLYPFVAASDSNGLLLVWAEEEFIDSFIISGGVHQISHNSSWLVAASFTAIAPVVIGNLRQLQRDSPARELQQSVSPTRTRQKYL